MPEFAEYQRRPADLLDIDVEIGPMTADDIEQCAQLAAARERTDMARWRESFQRSLDASGQLVLVAQRAGVSSDTARPHTWNPCALAAGGRRTAGT
ncbi:hypothetical protein [Tessaracoccus sp. ZS01]|uniref:hypothetical protein n=1 Tax=Tessaracoccus sp. ZS01 TaxID=1906324 RepID=UPI001E647C09|nr:hypothetical protein [Tessaracoccus sp. ZS01]